ncbi:MAG: undecaprenyl/decaprenyl-phosphate alpha-N-acetylglucosaminyl 1-phosphate transferase [Bacteroidales bacterium]|nr:undecaprenyl/decaprenyl-phosphate alpha-N-acetylglucosaminyl 1-phosphate transferase [Bacteroidales bacterium]
MISYLIYALIVPLIVAMHISPKVVRLAKEKNLTDCPGHRKLQTRPVPVVGGVCVFASFIFSLSFLMLFSDILNIEFSYPLELIISISMVFLIGFFDDMVSMSPWIKFVFQFANIAILYQCGYAIDTFNGLWGYYQLPMWLSLTLSLIAGVGLMNAINMIDGVNGLSSSVSIKFCFICACFLVVGGDWNNAVLATLFLSALIPFFVANVFSYKYKMFIGDSGTLMLGSLAYILVCSILKMVQGGAISETTESHSVALVLSIFAVPVFDTIRVMFTRPLKGKSPFAGDKTHLHHILLDLKVPHLMVTIIENVLVSIVFLTWLCTNWLVESPGWQLAIVVVVAIICTWGVYLSLSWSKEKNHRRFQRVISRFAIMAKFVWILRRKIERKYDGYYDRRGYSVSEFDENRD